MKQTDPENFVPDFTGQVLEGDNLKIIRSRLPETSIDLIYLDPPFNTGTRRSGSAVISTVSGDLTTPCAFDDKLRWDSQTHDLLLETIEQLSESVQNLVLALYRFLGRGTLMAYLTMMLPRLIECHRILKSDGNLFLHCDPSISHYLKLLLDSVFGREHFRNEIIWSYKSGGASKRRFARKHDVILFYARDRQKGKFNQIREKSYNRDLKPYRFKGVEEQCDKIGWYTLVNMKDVWQINMVGRTSSERVGYPTQKPVALLERIITAGSNEGDLVLDPFCGSGTTLIAAERLKRRWIGIDSSSQAVKASLDRLAKVKEIEL